MSSLPILLENTKRKLKASYLTDDPLIETRQSIPNTKAYDCNIREYSAQESLAIAILDELVGIGEKDTVKSFIYAV